MSDKKDAGAELRRQPARRARPAAAVDDSAGTGSEFDGVLGALEDSAATQEKPAAPAATDGDGEGQDSRGASAREDTAPSAEDQATVHSVGAGSAHDDDQGGEDAAMWRWGATDDEDAEAGDSEDTVAVPRDLLAAAAAADSDSDDEDDGLPSSHEDDGAQPGLRAGTDE
ncbi:MAG: hypothetical protein GY772_06640, partial [bacterium]|nr:hypothetical protein [bacterium]